MIEPKKSAEYRVVDPGDIFVAYGKYLGKPIEVRNVNCYYADKEDYRCVAAGSSTVAFLRTTSSQRDGTGGNRKRLRRNKKIYVVSV